MKKVKMLILLSLITVFSCSKDSTDGYVPNTSIVNDWTLVKSTGTVAGSTNIFTSGTIVWKFNYNNTVNIINNNLDETLQDGFPTGTYSYAIINNSNNTSCEQKIIIDNNSEFKCVIVSDNLMQINQGVDDGINYYFEKIMPFELL